MPTHFDFVLRLLLAAALAATVGIERELTDQHAGIRTHMLVGLGAVLFAIVSAFGFQAIAEHGPTQEVRADVTRVASQIVVGLGFIGAGVIVKSGAGVRGLTTAASLWVTGAIGTAVGVGMLLEATALAGFTMIVLVGMRPFRRFLHKYSSKRKVAFEAEDGDALKPLMQELQQQGLEIREVQTDENGADRIRLIVNISKSAHRHARQPARAHPEA